MPEFSVLLRRLTKAVSPQCSSLIFRPLGICFGSSLSNQLRSPLVNFSVLDKLSDVKSVFKHKNHFVRSLWFLLAVSRDSFMAFFLDPIFSLPVSSKNLHCHPH